MDFTPFAKIIKDFTPDKVYLQAPLVSARMAEINWIQSILRDENLKMLISFVWICFKYCLALNHNFNLTTLVLETQDRKIEKFNPECDPNSV